MIAHLLAAILLSAPAAEDQDAAELMQAMQQACRDLGGAHFTLEVLERPVRGEASKLSLEVWMDVRHQRLRVEVRDPRRPTPRLTIVDTPRGLLMRHADAEQVTQDPGPRDWPRMLGESLVGELWRTAFAGQLVGMRLASYGAPEWLGLEELGDVSCDLLRFRGNADAHLWIDRDLRLPRRIVGRLPDMVRDERVVKLQTNPGLDDALFHLAPEPYESVVPLAIARQSWPELPPEPRRWPAAGTRAPEVHALDLEGAPVAWPATEVPSVLAFWFAGSTEVVARLVQLEESLAARGDDVTLHSIHHGSDGPAIRAAVEEAGLLHEVWMSGTAPENPFRTYRIASCPVFFVLGGDRTVLGASREVEDVLRLLERGP